MTDMKNDNVICILAKDPQPGTAKHKLERYLSRKQAAMLARAFLLDSISTALRFPWCRTCLAFWPPEAEENFRDILFLFQREEKDKRIAARAEEIVLIPFADGNPGARITGLADLLFTDGARNIIFICADSPLIEPLILRASLELLKKHQVVIGPTFDGGYYIFGLSEPCPTLFDGIDWGAVGVYRQITHRLDFGNIDWQEMELSYDVDRPEELEQLYFDIDNLRLAGKNDICYHTEKCLANLKK